MDKTENSFEIKNLGRLGYLFSLYCFCLHFFVFLFYKSDVMIGYLIHLILHLAAYYIDFKTSNSMNIFQNHTNFIIVVLEQPIQ